MNRLPKMIAHVLNHPPDPATMGTQKIEAAQTGALTISSPSTESQQHKSSFFYGSSSDESDDDSGDETSSDEGESKEQKQKDREDQIKDALGYKLDVWWAT